MGKGKITPYDSSDLFIIVSTDIENSTWSVAKFMKHKYLIKLGVLLRYFNNNIGVKCLPLTPRLSNLLNEFQCIYHRLDTKLGFVRLSIKYDNSRYISKPSFYLSVCKEGGLSAVVTYLRK